MPCTFFSPPRAPPLRGRGAPPTPSAASGSPPFTPSSPPLLPFISLRIRFESAIVLNSPFAVEWLIESGTPRIHGTLWSGHWLLSKAAPQKWVRLQSPELPRGSLSDIYIYIYIYIYSVYVVYMYGLAPPTEETTKRLIRQPMGFVYLRSSGPPTPRSPPRGPPEVPEGQKI